MVFSSYIKLVNSFSRYSVITERSTKAKYFLGLESKDGIHFVRERKEIGHNFKYKSCRERHCLPINLQQNRNAKVNVDARAKI